MRRGYNSNGLGNRVARVAGALLLAGAGVFVLTQLDSVRRYLRIRLMSGPRHPTPPGTVRPGTEAPPRWGTSHWPVH